MNRELLVMLRDSRRDLKNWNPPSEVPEDFKEYTLAIEQIASMGMTVGAEVFETCVWTGRFIEAWHAPEEHRRVTRNQCKLYVCGNGRAKDANVRQAIIDRFPGTGTGKVPQVGTVKKPGPLYGMNSHMWPALAVAITVYDSLKMRVGAICPACNGAGGYLHEYGDPLKDWYTCATCNGQKIITHKADKHATTSPADRRPAPRRRTRL